VPETSDGFVQTPVSHAVFRVARLHKALAGSLLRDLGLHPGQELVLIALWTGGPQRQVDLVEATDTDAPSMARSIARLERSGLVRRTRSTTDRRAVVVEATTQSLRLRPAVEEAWRELERATMGDMTPEEQQEVVGALALLEANLLRHGSLVDADDQGET